MIAFAPFVAKASLYEAEEVEHVASPDCWCCPTPDDGVWVHHTRVPERWERAQAMGKGLAYLHSLPPSSRA